MKNPYEIMLASLQSVPEEYFRNRNNMDESIYIYFDRIHYLIEGKDKIFIDKKTSKRNAFELNHSRIYPTKAETVKKHIEATIGKERAGKIEKHK